MQEGYQLTEVGMIPSDWNVSEIGQLTPYVTSGSRGWADYYSPYGDLFVRITNMKRGSIHLDLSNNRYVMIPSVSSEGKRTALEDGDVLISITADIGICSYVDKGIPKPAYINQHIALVRFDDQRVCPKFVSYFLASENVQKLFRGNTDQGAKAGMNLKAVREIKFSLPTIDEQTAIANALSDVDTLITSLEKLIAKKRAIKTATMQQLLTGQKRLPPFDQPHSGYKQTELGEIPEDWELHRLGDCVKSFQLGGNYKNSVTNTGAPLIKMGNMARGYISLKKIEHISRDQPISEKDRCQENDIYFNTRNTLQLVGKVSIWRNELPKAYFNSNLMRIKFKKSIVSSHSFMNYLMNTTSFIGALADVAIGTTSVAAIYTRDLVELRIFLPHLDEQTVIAEILESMDAEVKVLEQRLTKTQQLKQGMMQELLTGRTRLL